MPRAESKHSLGGTQFYHSQFSNNHSQYLPDSGSSSPQLSPAPQHAAHHSSQSASAAVPKKKHICPTCDRAFTTSGHLARHSRVHTGERNHKCPFPGCETRCSRQDNLQQHYRIHLSPGSRRSSTRSAIARAMNPAGSGKRNSSSSSESPSAPPSLSSPPALEPARVYSHHSTPPDSPPPLAQATLPATAHLPDSASSRSSSSPETSYSPINHHLVPMSSQGINMPGSNSQQPYSYRSGTTTYQEQSQGAGFTYVHTTPISHSSSSSNGNTFSSYSSSHDDFSNHSLPHINTNTSSPVLHQQHLQDSPTSQSSMSMSSRHSISHISHPQSSYSQNQPSSAGPPSPTSSHSVSSHTSGPPTPTYSVFNDEAHTYHHGSGMISDAPGLSSGHISPQGHLVHPSYSPSMHNGSRFDSPPPVLAPIQNDRHVRSEDRLSQSQPQLHGSSPYIHHPQPLPTEYQYHQSMGLGHGAWKADSGMRKGVALVQ